MAEYRTIYNIGMIAGVLALVFGLMGGAQYMLEEGQDPGISKSSFNETTVPLIEQYYAQNNVRFQEGDVIIKDGFNSGNISYNVSQYRRLEIDHSQNNNFLEHPIRIEKHPSGVREALRGDSTTVDITDTEFVVILLDRTDSFPNPEIRDVAAGEQATGGIFDTEFIQYLGQLQDLPGALQYLIAIPMALLVSYIILRQVNPLG